MFQPVECCIDKSTLLALFNLLKKMAKECCRIHAQMNSSFVVSDQCIGTDTSGPVASTTE